MTSPAPTTRIAIFQARDRQGDQLAEHLLDAASLIAEAPGCELWLVSRDRDAPDTLRVVEMWASPEQRDTALELPEVKDHAERAMKLLASSPETVDGQPVGGARMLRGQTGASRFSILDAPDLSKDTELLGRYDLGQVPEARYVREQLNAVAVGLTHYRLGPEARQGWAHRHRVSEEIYVALSGSGYVSVDGQQFALETMDAVRVAPGSTRELQAGPAGLEVLAFGSHSPGDGEMVRRDT
jgi:quinol monooxygenase YgiN/mannose-6-phosphate isomerase-like protein (cupin superfamily)